jgi:hypothetical protein
MSTADGTQDTRQAKRRTRARVIAKVQSLEMLVGGHPDAMRDIYASGTPLDPTELGEAPGRLLTVEPLADTYMLTKPLVELASRIDPWRGKRFERGGTAGKDLVFSLQAFRFRCEVGRSEIDGEDTLRLTYDGLGNPWPVSRTRCELRRVGETTAIGPAWLGDRLWLWWGVAVAPATES